MFVNVDHDSWVNPDHVEMVHKNAAGAVVISLRSGRRFLIYGKTVDEVLNAFGGKA